MSHRVVQGLSFAGEGLGPGWGPSRPRGAKAEGVAYEKRVAKRLPEARHGVWWRYEDRGGPGWCQTDLLLLGASAALVLEVKLSLTLTGFTQLEQLYLPVVGRALGLPVYGVQVCKYLRPDVRVAVARDLGEALSLAKGGGRVALHWIGEGALLPRAS